MKKSLVICSSFVVLLAAFALVWNAHVSATPVLLAPLPQFYATDNSGKPLAFGCVFTYISGTTSPLATYTDSSGTIPNQNPVKLSAAGNANIWIQAGQAYTFKVVSAGGTNCADGSIRYTVNGISGGSSQLSTNVASSTTPQFTAIAQNQLFIFTITSNTVALPLVVNNVQAPAFISFKIINTCPGACSFTWPSNTAGGGNPLAAESSQTFLWNGSLATAVGPMLTGEDLSGLTSPGPIQPTLHVKTNALVDQNLTMAELQFTSNGITAEGFAGPGGDIITGNAGLLGNGICSSGGTNPGATDCGFQPTRIIDCGFTAFCFNGIASQPVVVMGTRTLSGGTATVSGITPAFASASAFVCVANDITALGSASAQPSGADSIVLSGSGTDTLSYICAGHNP